MCLFNIEEILRHITRFADEFVHDDGANHDILRRLYDHDTPGIEPIKSTLNSTTRCRRFSLDVDISDT